MIVPSPGEAAITTGSARSRAKVADQVGGGERDEEAADSLADEEVGAAAASRAAGSRRSGSILLAGELRRQVGETGGP